MIYNKLAEIYDGLVKDDEATKSYVKFLKTYLPEKGSFLELGCGSGEITNELAKSDNNYNILATDISEQMIDVAKNKTSLDNLHYEVKDMRKLDFDKTFDAIYCICDSINYLTNDEFFELLDKIYKMLKDHGVFIFDMHSLDRLEEFKEEFYEAGIVDGVDYTWSIISDHNDIIQNFIFYDDNCNRTYEHHIQHVFDPNRTITKLNQIGFKTQIYTDFDLIGICEGEKYFIIAKKEK